MTVFSLRYKIKFSKLWILNELNEDLVKTWLSETEAEKEEGQTDHKARPYGLWSA